MSRYWEDDPMPPGTAFKRRIYARLMEKAAQYEDRDYRDAANVIVSLTWGSDLGGVVTELIERSR